MIGAFVLGGASLIAAQLPLSPSERATIESVAEAHRQPGFGPAVILAAASADLTRDGEVDLAAVYHYQIGPARDRSATQWIVVLAKTAAEHVRMGPMPIGGKGSRLVEEMVVRADTIVLRGRQYLVGDPMCCPGGQFEQRLIVTEGVLREERGTWIRVRSPSN